MDIQDIADDVSKDIGKKISPKKRDFALLKAIEPDMTNTDIAKQIANTKHPTQDGYKLAVDPSVQALVEKYQEVMQFSRFKVFSPVHLPGFHASIILKPLYPCIKP